MTNECYVSGKRQVKQRNGYGPVFALLLGLAAVAQMAGGPASAWAQDELFVTDCGSNFVRVFARTANGNTAPLRTLQGAATGLICPHGLAVDSLNNELLVQNNTSITVYPRTASGNTAPLRTLQGPATGLNHPGNLFVDTVNDELLVTDLNGPSVAVFTRTASGNTAPLRTLQGAATALGLPQAVAVDSVNDELFVVNSSGPRITVYPRTASGNTAPLRTLEGSATGLNSPSALFVDQVNDELAVSNFANPPSSLSSLRIYARTADGNTAPLRVIWSPALLGPLGLAVDTVNNEILVVKNLNGATFGSSSPSCGIAASIPQGVLVFPRTASGEICPLRHLQGTGTATGLTNPQFLAVTTSISQSDCLFNWAERNYPSLFAPAGAISNTLAPYYYRYYPQTNAYLATSSADNQVYYLGPVSNNSIFDVGALSGWLSTAGCHNASNPTLTVAKSGTGSGTVTSSPSGVDCGSTCSAQFQPGSQVTLTASPASASTFTGWSGSCSGTAACQVTMDADKAVTATFTLTPTFTLTVTKAGTGSGTVTSSPTGISCGATCSATYASATSVTLTATPAAGSTFTGWSGACAGTGSCTVTMNAAKAVTATFTLNFPFQGSVNGVWGGTCDGSPFGGSFSVSISANGTVSGFFSGDDSGSISGSVTSTGGISATLSGSAAIFSWSGQASRSGSSLSASGSYSGAGCSGTWSGSGLASS